MARRTLAPLLLVLLALAFISVLSTGGVEANFLNEPFAMEQTCHSIQTKIHINREENDDFGNPLRSCEGSAEVTKCEGTCNSHVQPSLSAPHGFHKECNCCRETHMERRGVVLDQCYDVNGERILGPLGAMELELKVPSGCTCVSCTL
ncbi:partner of bursicon-like [Tropilaelaps mercedesae]|uniref:Partner of bursicon-like n=1 Tax=Tropilaelaps mercedesae TaxID=418985 RepID=A0A1V9XKF6_9ACAR|nr:partner of bursicon-like [Tropilaelaps mercedesae]